MADLYIQTLCALRKRDSDSPLTFFRNWGSLPVRLAPSLHSGHVAFLNLPTFQYWKKKEEESKFWWKYWEEKEGKSEFLVLKPKKCLSPWKSSHPHDSEREGTLRSSEHRTSVSHGGQGEEDRGNGKGKQTVMSQDTPSLASQVSPQEVETAPEALQW